MGGVNGNGSRREGDAAGSGSPRDPREALARRLEAVRVELFGDDGVAELARRLGLPPRTWANYEQGATVPAEVMLAFLVVTGVEPGWLLDGRGPKFRVAP